MEFDECRRVRFPVMTMGGRTGGRFGDYKSDVCELYNERREDRLEVVLVGVVDFE